MGVIACIGWGSLVWDSDALPLASGWSSDGPAVKVEFLRQSRRGDITLVLHDSAAPVPGLWAIMRATDIRTAAGQLAAREGMPSAMRIGTWGTGQPAPALIPDLDRWAAGHDVHAAVWTGLPVKFADQEGRVARVDEVIGYLHTLQGEALERAERYIRKAPRQILTIYRARMEAEFGWVPET